MNADGFSARLYRDQPERIGAELVFVEFFILILFYQCYMYWSNLDFPVFPLWLNLKVGQGRIKIYRKHVGTLPALKSTYS